MSAKSLLKVYLRECYGSNAERLVRGCENILHYMSMLMRAWIGNGHHHCMVITTGLMRAICDEEYKRELATYSVNQYRGIRHGHGCL